MITLEDVYKIFCMSIKQIMINGTTLKSQTMQTYFGNRWKMIDTIHSGVDQVGSHQEGLLTMQETIIMMIINNFLLLNMSEHRIPWNLLDIFHDIMEEGTMYAWALVILQQMY